MIIRSVLPSEDAVTFSFGRGRGDGLGELHSGLNSASPPSRVPIFLDARVCVLMNSLNTNEAGEDQGPPQGLTQSRMNIY